MHRRKCAAQAAEFLGNQQLSVRTGFHDLWRASCVRLSNALLMKMRVSRFAITVVVLLVASCAAPLPRSDDPYEAFNRKMYAFNNYADRVAVRPVAQAYRAATTQSMRRIVSNFLRTLKLL